MIIRYFNPFESDKDISGDIKAQKNNLKFKLIKLLNIFLFVILVNLT